MTIRACWNLIQCCSRTSFRSPRLSPGKGLDLLRHEDVHLVLLDVRLPDINGIEVLRRIKALDENVDVIMITAVKDVRVAVEAIKLGAYDYLEPFEIDEVLSLLRRTLEHQNLLREVLYLRDLRAEVDRSFVVGRSPKMRQIYDLIARVADTNATVLISGESGVGKELIARATHQQSQRHPNPFVALNCAAISEHLVESELFGHERGAFTGAVEMHRGKFELAHTGTLFLDEVGSLRLDLQAKLLRVLQEREFERVGGGKTIRTDVRIVAASNQDLRQMVADRTFRDDLFYRLNVVQSMCHRCATAVRISAPRQSFPHEVQPGLWTPGARHDVRGAGAPDPLSLARECSRVGECDRTAGSPQPSSNPRY